MMIFHYFRAGGGGPSAVQPGTYQAPETPDSGSKCLQLLPRLMMGGKGSWAVLSLRKINLSRAYLHT